MNDLFYEQLTPGRPRLPKILYILLIALAAAIGVGLDLLKPFGNMIVDIGAGTTDVAVLSMGGVVVQNSVKVGGDNFNHAIMTYIRNRHSLFIGEDAAENIKKKIGCASESSENRTFEIKGRNVVTGLPKVTVLSSEEIRIALKDVTNQSMEAIQGVLEKTPPELASDIMDRGIVLTGGGALLRGIDDLVEEKTGVRAVTAEDARTAAVMGTCKYADVMAKIE